MSASVSETTSAETGPRTKVQISAITLCQLSPEYCFAIKEGFVVTP